MSSKIVRAGYYGNLSQSGDLYSLAVGGLFLTRPLSSITTTGWFVVDSIVYSEGCLISVKMRFAQYCDGYFPLYGALDWAADNPFYPLGPHNPPPNLWQPLEAYIPSSVNYLYLMSSLYNLVNLTSTPINSIFNITENAGVLSMEVQTNVLWQGTFAPFQPLSKLQPGFYPSLSSSFQLPGVSGISLLLSGDADFEGVMSAAWFMVVRTKQANSQR